MTPAEEREQERRQAVLAAIQRTKLMLKLERKQFEDADKLAYELDTVSSGVEGLK